MWEGSSRGNSLRLPPIPIAVLALWFPLAIAVATVVIWGFWLVLGISIKHQEVPDP